MKFLNYVLLVCIVSAGSLQAQSLTEEMEAIADIIVDSKGSGDYSSVQDGINAIPDFNDEWKIIFVKKGVYYEKVILKHEKTKVILVGEDVDSTKITYDDWANNVLPGHTFSTYTFRADANDFQAYNLSFECTAGSRGQGVAYHSNGDRQILYRCRLLGEQDTYFDNFRTRRYIKDCFIEGTIDYIFGFGVALFDSCQIHSLASSEITAAATPEHYEFGYIFRNSRITADPGVTNISLGRPWFDWANVIFYECWEPEALRAEGWSTWSGREATCLYNEYNCFGPGSDTVNRIEFGHQLDPSLAPRYTIDTIFAVSNFPVHLGYEGDTTELMHMYRRFEASGYPERADTILYAGRDSYPSYPTENWNPEFNPEVMNIVDSYTVAFMDSVNGYLRIDQIHWDGNPLPDFDPENTFYVVELDDTAASVPRITFEGEGIHPTIEYPGSLPGAVLATALSRDKVNGNDYTIYFSVDSAYWSTELSWVAFNEDTLWVEPGVREYDVVLPEGDTRITSLRIGTQYAGQQFQIQVPPEYPGVATITVTAPDTHTTGDYFFTIFVYPDAMEQTRQDEDILIINPATRTIQLVNTSGNTGPASLSVFDLGGRKLINSGDLALQPGICDTHLDSTVLPCGTYIYHLHFANRVYAGKLVKMP